MSVVLALQEKGVKVSVCGRLLDVSAESLTSVPTLRRDLATQIKLATPASLQLADLAGQPIRTDEELGKCLREGKYPLQAKLTVVAVHEIEQKKHEAETKKEELVQLQWQIVVEQVGQFSQEVANLAAQLQGVKDDCVKAVRQFEDAEELRRKQIFTSINQETSEREACHRDMLARVERLAQLITAERSARDVAAHQLNKQAEQVQAELNLERNSRVKDQAEIHRTLSALRHDLDLEAHKNSDSFCKTFDACKRAEVRLDEHQGVFKMHMARLLEAEGASEKIKGKLSGLQTSLEMHRRDSDEDMKRKAQEIDRSVRDGILGRENDIARLAKDLETSWHALEVRVQRSRDEAMEGQAMLAERSKALEQRCSHLEQQGADQRNLLSSKERAMHDRVMQAVSTVDGAEVERKANDAVIRSLALKVEDLMERVKTAEGDLTEKARHDHFNPHLEQFSRMLEKQETKLAELEKETSQRFMQEAAHRDGMKSMLQDGLHKTLDRIAQIPSEKVDKSRDTVGSTVGSSERITSFANIAASPRRSVSQGTASADAPPANGVIRRVSRAAEAGAMMPTQVAAASQTGPAIRTLNLLDGQMSNSFNAEHSTAVVPAQISTSTKVMQYPVQTIALHQPGIASPQPMPPSTWVGGHVSTLSPRGQSPMPAARAVTSARSQTSVPRLQNMPQ